MERLDGLMTVESGVTTVSQAVQIFIKQQTSENTRKAYLSDLKKWFEWLGEVEIVPTIENAVDFRVHLEQNFKSRTAARVFNTCRAFYRFMGGFNPFGAVKSPKRLANATPKVPDDALVIKMLDLVDNERDKFILTLLLNGLRRNEVAELPEDAIEWSAAYGCDVITVIGKGNKQRLIPANMETSLAFRDYSEADGWMFPGKKGGHITARTVEYVSEKWSSAAGLKTSPHKFRHHYATRLVRAGADVLPLAEMMGHASVATTQVYVKLDLSSMVRVAQLDPLNRKVVEID